MFLCFSKAIIFFCTEKYSTLWRVEIAVNKSCNGFISYDRHSFTDFWPFIGSVHSFSLNSTSFIQPIVACSDLDVSVWHSVLCLIGIWRTLVSSDQKTLSNGEVKVCLPWQLCFVPLSYSLTLPQSLKVLYRFFPLKQTEIETNTNDNKAFETETLL